MSTIQLQSIGHVPAVQASEIREGDVRMYNFGHTSLVVKVIEKTAKTLMIITYSPDSDKYFMSDIRKTSLVAITDHGQDVSMHQPKEACYVSGKNKGLVDVSEYFQTEEVVEEVETIEEVKENNLTNEQNETLSIRLNKSNVKPLRLFKSNNSDSILLECLNTNLNNPEPFYFIINSKGESFGKGYNYPLNEYTVIETYDNEPVETETQSETQPSQISYQTGTGNKGNGIEITFENKPSEEVRNAIKAAGYRWGGKQRPNIWWAIETNESLSIAEQLATKQQTEPIDYSYPEIDIDDNESYIIDQSLQDREHDSAWIFRQNKTDHNKEIQNMFNDYTNQVKSILENTSNEYFIYKLKSGLQRFKKKYHSLYIKYLSHKANNPSWAVTGRGNLNISKYNQKMQQQNNIMLELADLPKQFENELIKYRNKIRKGA